ncbi:ankyrin repeat-containing domain protein [Xylaria venustula]|nr:ankyrin repeat-containing domain protein [Xylaria venustula]
MGSKRLKATIGSKRLKATIDFKRLKRVFHDGRLGNRPKRRKTEDSPAADNKSNTDTPTAPDRSSVPNPSPINDQSTQINLPDELNRPAPKDKDIPIREFWKLAYENLRREEKDLIASYEEKLRGDLTAGLGSMLGSKVSIKDLMDTNIEKKMKEVERNRWKFKFGSIEVRFRDVMHVVPAVVGWVKDYIDEAASANPYTSIAWGGVSLLLPFLLNPSEQEIALAKGLESISSLIAQSRHWEDLYARFYESKTDQLKTLLPTHVAYREALEKLYREILKFQITAYCYYSSNSASRLGQDTVKWNEWEILLREITNKESVFSKVCKDFEDDEYHSELLAAKERHQEAMHGWQSMGMDLSELRKAVQDAQKDKMRDKFLQWLSTFDPSGMYNAARDKHQSGTGDWLMRDSKEFKTWESTASSLLWLHGKAGCGKSILSSSVIERLWDRHESDPGSAFAYFFFSFSDPESQKVDAMLSSLIKQLYASRLNAPQLVESLRKYKERDQRPNTKALESALIATASGFSSVSIVIDGLDECPVDGRDGNPELKGERMKLLDSLSRVITAMPKTDNMHILCTSRPESDIQATMSSIMSPPLRAAIDLSANPMNHDIGVCIDVVFSSVDYSHWPDDLKAEAKVILLEKADGMIQYVYCQFEELQRLSSVSHVRRTLRGLPTGLDATYDRLLQSLDQRYQTEIIQSLKWLAVSDRLLTVKELAEVFIARTDYTNPIDEKERLFEPELCLKYLSSLVVTQEARFGPLQVRLAHFSIKEYLISARIKNGPAAAFSFTETDAHTHIANLCLSYLCHLGTLGLVDTQSHELKKCAATFWAPHLEMVPRKTWPAEVILLATRALTIGSESLRIMVTECAYVSVPPQYYYITRTGDINRPQKFTARHGWLMLTEMLLSNPKLNRYWIQWDFDATLQEAALWGRIEIVQLLLDRRTDVDEEISKLGNALLAAVEQGHVDVVDLLLRKGAAANAQHTKYGSALKIAAQENHVDIVQLLVNHGADVNLAPNEAGCAITYSVPSRWPNLPNVEILQFLLDNGADINSQSGPAGTALHRAAANVNQDREHFHLLLERDADINARGGIYGYPLQAACLNHDSQAAVKLLLEKGADVNAQGGQSGNALQAACLVYEGEKISGSTVEVLLESGADINTTGGKFGTALQAACSGWYDPRNLVEFLLERGANVNIQGGYYGNALQAACYEGHLDIAQLLLSQGADVNARGGEHGSALVAACLIRRPHRYELVKLLLSKGANIHEKSWFRGTALQVACYQSDIFTVQLLLDYGAQVNAVGGEYGTALQAAIVHEVDIDVLELLIKHGADVNAVGGEYGTALQAACAANDNYETPVLDVVKLLIEHGADVHLQGGIFGSVWHAAAHEEMHDDSLLQLLLDRGVDINDARGLEHPTALHAVLNNDLYAGRSVERVRFLLGHGAHVNVMAGMHGSPLQSICARERNYARDCQLVEFLLENCPDIEINAPHEVFGSALQAAARSGQTHSVKLLIDKGANVNARGGKYRSALNAAVFKGFWAIVEILLDNGAKPDRQPFLEADEDWLKQIQDEVGEEAAKQIGEVATREAGKEAVARYRVFCAKQPVNEDVA